MNQQPQWGPQGPYGQPGYGPPPQRKGVPAIVWVLLGLFGIPALCVVGCFVCAGAAASRAAALASASASQTPDLAPTPPPQVAPTPTVDPEADLPWIAQVRANCTAYKAAPNEIKKSAIFNANQALLGGVKVANVRGTLRGLQTNQGGSELKLTIKVGRVEFTTESVLSPVKKGSAVYNAASDMTTGQCVVFSAQQLRPSSMSERAQVCDTEYFANFTSLASCE